MRIVNIGSLNIDYVYDVDHFVEKGETTASFARNVFAGGKGLNQSLALGRAGADVSHAGLVGEEGGFLRDLLAGSGVGVDFVRTADGCSSGHAVIQRDRGGDNCIILYGGANHRVDEAFVDEALAGFSAGDWLLLQNETSCLSYAIAAAKRRGMWVALNPSPVTDDLLDCPLDQVDCFILNEGEAARLAGCDGAGEELLAAMRVCFPAAEVVLTLGEKGSLYAGAGGSGQALLQPAFKANAVDTTAAGDTFTGYYLAARSRGAEPACALEVAAAAAALAVSRMGAAPSIPCRDEVWAFLRPEEGVA